MAKVDPEFKTFVKKEISRLKYLQNADKIIEQVDNLDKDIEATSRQIAQAQKQFDAVEASKKKSFEEYNEIKQKVEDLNKEAKDIVALTLERKTAIFTEAKEEAEKIVAAAKEEAAELRSKLKAVKEDINTNLAELEEIRIQVREAKAQREALVQSLVG